MRRHLTDEQQLRLRDLARMKPLFEKLSEIDPEFREELQACLAEERSILESSTDERPIENPAILLPYLAAVVGLGTFACVALAMGRATSTE